MRDSRQCSGKRELEYSSTGRWHRAFGPGGTLRRRAQPFSLAKHPLRLCLHLCLRLCHLLSVTCVSLSASPDCAGTCSERRNVQRSVSVVVRLIWAAHRHTDVIRLVFG